MGQLVVKWLSILHLALMPRIRVIAVGNLWAAYVNTVQKPTGSAIGRLWWIILLSVSSSASNEGVRRENTWDYHNGATPCNSPSNAMCIPVESMSIQKGRLVNTFSIVGWTNPHVVRRLLCVSTRQTIGSTPYIVQSELFNICSLAMRRLRVTYVLGVTQWNSSPNWRFTFNQQPLPTVPPIDLTKALNRRDLTFNVNLDHDDTEQFSTFVHALQMATRLTINGNMETPAKPILLNHSSVQRACCMSKEQLIPDFHIYLQSFSFASTITTMP